MQIKVNANKQFIYIENKRNKIIDEKVIWFNVMTRDRNEFITLIFKSEYKIFKIKLRQNVAEKISAL